MTVLGTISLWLALLLSVWGAFVGLLGLRLDRAALRESARRATVALAATLAAAVFSLLAALFRLDFNVAYVADHASRNLAGPYLAATLHAGWEGKVLVGAFLFSLPAALSRAPGGGQVVAALGLLALFVAALLAGNPFTRLPVTPIEGSGLHPTSLNAGFVVGAPLVLLGYAALATGLSRVAGSAVTGHRADALRAAGWWILAGWVLVSAGATVGLWWAYGFAAVGGLRVWDPTGSGAVPVWLVVTAVLGGAWFSRLRGHGAPASRRRGALVVSTGLLLLVLAGLGQGLGVEREIHLKPGETASLRSRLGPTYTLSHMGVSRFETVDRFVTAATLEVERGGTPVGLVISERRQYIDALGRAGRAPITTAGVHRGPVEDLRVVLLDHAAATEEAVYRVRINPLMWCVWLGVGLAIAGGLLALVPIRI